MPLILEGIIQDVTLENMNKDKDWLIEKINKKNIDINNIFYCFYKNKKIYIIKKP